jgi:NAD(P)-dependent dehydrogenase (short-subunit alcohol dehydrogenase family)
VAPFDLGGRVAVVTGGASGIGVGIANLLAQAGATVVIADCDAAGAAVCAAELTNQGLQAGFVAVDLADEAAIVAACRDMIDRFGVPWILVNNAGIQDRQLLLDATTQEWDRMQAVNARAPFVLTRELGRAMVERGEGGRIINVATAGLRGFLIKGLASYVASKGALQALSQASAFEFAGYGITVNTVLPGPVATPGAINAKGPPTEGPARRSLPLGRICEPADIAAAVYFFATPAARYVTNQVVAVDAGFSIS